MAFGLFALSTTHAFAAVDLSQSEAETGLSTVTL